MICEKELRSDGDLYVLEADTPDTILENYIFYKKEIYPEQLMGTTAPQPQKKCPHQIILFI